MTFQIGCKWEQILGMLKVVIQNWEGLISNTEAKVIERTYIKILWKLKTCTWTRNHGITLNTSWQD